MTLTVRVNKASQEQIWFMTLTIRIETTRTLVGFHLLHQELGSIEDGM